MPNLEKYLNQSEDLPVIKRFSFLGSSDQFRGKLKYLIKIAEPELWNQVDDDSGYENSTIYYYIIHTFERIFAQGKIFISDDEEIAFFNTGLMTIQGYEIFGHFCKSSTHNPSISTSNYWYFKGFIVENDKYFMENCPSKPEIATYFDDYKELYFNPLLPINVNFEHIYLDNFDRLPTAFKTLPDQQVAWQVFEGFLNFTKKKIRRNNRIPVPQFYKNKIMFLIPVKVFGTEIMVLGLEKINEQYLANTILTIGMAYNCARLLNKPESDWLLTGVNAK